MHTFCPRRLKNGASSIALQAVSSMDSPATGCKFGHSPKMKRAKLEKTGDESGVCCL